MNLNKIVEKCIRAVLNEAADDTFSLEELTSIRSFAGRKRYCDQHLGAPIGRGTSRLVYQIDDNKVLKLAMNTKGIDQNEEEGRPDYYKANLGIFPEIFEVDEDKYYWIVSEFVLKAKPRDFVECFGITEDEFFAFINTMQMQHRYPFKALHIARLMNSDDAEDLMERNEYLRNFQDFIGNYTHVSVGDLFCRRNYGLTIRDGEPVVVILDSGLSEDVWNRHYKRR